ncbi:hypothetical protein RclHR1_08630005 [Rhizophagus clarus]|uniref:Myb-like domain-containing protein n=1 Tax=Rhizophagus clarus TaxID=94130 RepID=A0A2Z6S1R0_9GLOM|nr:hypothetical protein RclHR1_08630005 [Rhizophagus clarus]
MSSTSITYRRGPWNKYEINKLIDSMNKHGHGPRQRKLIEKEVGRTYIECKRKYEKLFGVQNHRRNRHILLNNRRNDVVDTVNIVLTIPPVNPSNHHRSPLMELSYILNDDDEDDEDDSTGSCKNNS